MIRRFLAVFLLLGLASQLQSQEIFISYQADDKPLNQVFRDLEKVHDIYFAFSPGQIKGKKATIDAQQVEINTFLQQLLRPHKLQFELFEEKFISVKTPESVYLRAQVFDGETGETLPFATARLKDTYLGGVADQDGRFRLFIDQPLDATMEFSFLGYDSEELELNTYQSGTEIRITLQPEAQTLERVTIKEYVNSGISSDEKASSFKIRPQEMEILPGLSERDVLLSAQIISGINSNDETASGLNIRGSARDNTFIYWNNIPMYQSAHYFGNISSFIPATIGEVDIYKNYVPVKYGGASSGLMKMTTRAENNGEKDFEVSLNMTHIDAYAQLPFLKDYGAVMIAARRSYNDLWATPTFNAISDKVFEGSLTQNVQTTLNPDFRYNSSINFGDVNLQWLYEPSNRSTWQFSTLYSGSAMNYDSQFDLQFNDESWFQNHNVNSLGANLTWNYRMNDNLSSEVSLSASSYSLDYGLTIEFETEELGGDDDDEEEEEEFSERDAIINDVTNLELRTAFNWKISDQHFLNFGYQLNAISAEIDIRNEDIFEENDTSAISTEGLINAVFGELIWDPTERLQVIGALRLNHYGPSQELVTDAQLRVNYDLNDLLVLKAATGNYNQYLTAVTDGDFNFSNTIEQHWILADDDEFIPIVSAWQTSIGFLFSQEDWIIDFDLYTKTIDGILARNMGFSFTESDGLDVGTDEILGVDLTVMKKWNQFRLFGSYNFQDSQLSFDNPLLQPSPFPSSFNIRHQLQASASYTAGSIEYSLGYTYKSGLPFTPALEVLQGIPDEPEDEIFYEILEGNPNSARQPDYHRVDASAWYKFGSGKTGRKWAGEIGISLLNVFNIRNVGRRTFDLDGDETDLTITPELVRIDQILLGFNPNLTLRFRF